LKKGFLFYLISMLALSGVTLAQQLKLGDIDDGSRAERVHLIELFDERGQIIYPDDDPAVPFSMRQTCGDCHTYDLVSQGWHFNAVDPNVPPGRPGQPWILVENSLGMQVPLSYRDWPGTFNPEELGISTFEFTTRFGRQMPGGGPGEIPSEKFDEIMRAEVSGDLEINCFSCHSGHSGQDHAEYADLVRKQNFRWAPTGASELATVTGSAKEMPDMYDYLAPSGMADEPTVTYREHLFDNAYRVILDVGGKIESHQCYRCHSNRYVETDFSPVANADEDVHLHAGMTCVDCHTEDSAHHTIRGYEGEHKVSANPMAEASTCQGCHMGIEEQQHTTAGRFSGPVPDHKGIPPIHFDKLTCTACHSGLWPEEQTAGVLTSRAHALGTHESLRDDEALPGIITPVFVTGYDGRIEPANLVWPAYWALRQQDGITPITLEDVQDIAGPIIERMLDVPARGWPDFTEAVVEAVLEDFSQQFDDEPVYISNGRLYYLDDDVGIADTEDPAAKPYSWPVAHNVRPAAQSLGVRGCEDCHSAESPFNFGEVMVEGPVGEPRFVQMFDFQDVDPTYLQWFAWSWMFRNALKVVSISASLVLVGVLLLYALKALQSLSAAKTEK